MKRITALLLVMLMMLSLFPPRRALAMESVFDHSDSYYGSEYHTALRRVELSGDLRSDIVAVALSQVGYHEGSSPTDLSGSSSGKKNFTEYGKNFGLEGDSWCAVFVWWCARQAGVQESIIHKTEWAKTRLQPFASLPFEQCGTIRPGDIAFIDTSGGTGRENHVGIIAEVSSDRITVVEGNSGDKVVTHSYSRGSGSCLTASSSTCILFVGSPDYNGVNSAHASYSTALAYAPGTQAYSSPNGSRTEKLGSREYMILYGDLSGEWIQIVAEDGLGSWFIPSEGVTIIERDLPPITGYDAWGGYSVPAATTTAAATTTTIAATTTTASSTAATDTEVTVGDHPSGEETQTTVPTGIHTEPTHPEHSVDDSRPSADSGGSKWTSVAIFSLIGVACLGILACVGGNSRRRKTR